MLRWGILSTGNIARQFAAGVAVSRRGGLTAVGSRDLSSAQAFASTFNIPHAFGGYEAVLQCAEVDAIYNALPNSMHHKWTLAALRAGKHVLCEKPLASNEPEAREMFEVAEQCGRVLMEAFMYRSHPQTLAVMETLQSGAIGELKLIRTSFCYRTRKVAGNIRFDRQLAGGALMDVGCYCINFSRFFAGAEPAGVQVFGHVHPSGVDDQACGILAFPKDIHATFACGMGVQADNTAYLCGSEGYIEIPVPWKPPKEEAHFTIAHGAPPKMDSVGKAAAITPPRERRDIRAEGDLYGIEADDFAETILNGQPARISRDDSLGNMRVLDVMRRQLETI